MRLRIKEISLTLLFVCSLLNEVNAQMKEPGVTDADYKTIQQLLGQRLNKNLKVIGIINFGSAKTAESWIFEKPVRDPYGTFKDCYLFFASNRFGSDEFEIEDRIGITKNEELLWLSDPLNTSTNFGGGNLRGALDLNKDGVVEFWVALYHGMQGQREYLLIYEWNGNRAELISSKNEDGQSDIKMRRGSSELVDIEPDGVLEIKGEWFDGHPKLYSWNGQKYGSWGVSLPSRLPRDAMEIQVRTEVKQAQDNSKLRFQYILYNKTNSLQSIEEVAIKNFSTAPENVTSPRDWEFNPHIKGQLVSWQVELFLEQHRDALLEPGESDSSFSFTTIGLPRPSIYYAQGNNGDLSNDTDDLVNNSVTGFTLGPYNPPDPFDADTFTDSLRSYTSQACELEWITNRGICNSLEKKLDNVNRQLERGNIKTATNNVQAFLNEVEAVRRNHLTSEGYGLLWFNGQYLLGRLSSEN